jgi:hypothetical protein
MLKINFVFCLFLISLFIGCEEKKNQTIQNDELRIDSISLKQSDFEKQIEDSKKDLVISESTWLPYSDDFPMGYLYISIQNNGHIDYKDVKIKIKYFSKSGTYLSDGITTLYEIFPAGKLIKIDEFKTGLAPQGTRHGEVSIISATPYN